MLLRRRIHAVLANLVSLPFLACSPAGDPVDEATRLLAEGAPDEAILALQRALDADPGDPALNHAYGAALMRHGHIPSAVWSLRKAAAAPGFEITAGMALASALLAGGAPEDAKDAAKRVLEFEPENVAALKIVAQAALLGTEKEEALEALELVLDIDPDDLGAAQSRLEALLRLQYADEASETFIALRRRVEAGRDVDPALVVRLCVQEATFRHENREAAAALRVFEECFSRNPTDILVVTSYVDHLDAIGESDRGTEILEKAVALGPERVDLRAGLGNRYRRLGRGEEAGKLLREGAERAVGARRPLAWSAYADHLVAQGDFAGAVEVLDEANRGTPVAEWSEEIRFALGDLLVLAGRFDRVPAIVDAMDEPAHRFFVLGHLHYAKEEFAEALAAYQQGFAAWPSHPMARYYAARSAEQVGRFDEAIVHYRESIRADAAASDAGWRLSRIREAEGSRRAALEAMQRYASGHPDDVSAALEYYRLRGLQGDNPPSVDGPLPISVPEGELIARFAASRARFLAETSGPAIALEYLASLGESVDDEDASSFAAHAARAEIEVATGDAERARHRVAALRALHADDPRYALLEGWVLAEMGLLDEARARVSDAREAAPAALGMAARVHAEIEARAGRIDAAIDLLASAAASDVRDVRPRWRAILLLAEAGREADVAARLNSLLQDFPWHGRGAYALAVQRQGDERLPLAIRAFRFDGSEAARTLLLGEIEEAGDRKEAEALARTAPRTNRRWFF